jgi:probable biosynthetic protein (TIGR04098 family)
VDPEELHGRPREGCLYVESFNRWVSRSREGSNRELVRASPPDFRHRHLPTLPERYSPRHAFHRAREEGSFHPPPPDAATDELTFDYPIDVTRDVNGVGLVYFAAYFSIVERAVFELWRRLGRSPRAFLERIVVDHRICYLGNADVDAVLTLRTRRWTAPGDPAREHFDVTVEDRDSHRRLAVATVQILTEHPR